jgi:hypothetical protein
MLQAKENLHLHVYLNKKKKKKKNNTINCAELNESIYLIIKIITKTKQKYNEKTSLFQHLLYTHTK